jgi:lipid-binding SYLF domain-containing protein
MCLNNILYVCMFVLEYLKCFSGPIVTLLSLTCMVKVGGELTDFIIVLRTAKAVKAFGGRAHLSLGAGMSAAAGPVGRAAEADLRAGDGGAAACYTYSCSKGAFVGVSLEYNVVATRTATNLNFYGDAYLTATDILLGPVPQPRAAAPLYAALQSLFGKVDSITSD